MELDIGFKNGKILTVSCDKEFVERLTEKIGDEYGFIGIKDQFLVNTSEIVFYEIKANR